MQRVSELIEQQGFDRLKMVDIASACDMSVGALYTLFSSKEELFYAYIEYQIELFYRTLRAIFLSTPDPHERIRLFIKTKFEIFRAKERVLQDTLAADPLFFAKLNISKQNPAKKIYLLLAKQLEAIGARDGLRLAYILGGVTLGYVEMWLAGDGELDAQEAYEYFLKMIR